MRKFIAPTVISINGGPSPCECTDTVVCAYCVQANMILWEKEEKSPGEEATLETFKKMQRGKLARLLGVNRSTVSRWLKLKRVPPKYYPTRLSINATKSGANLLKL
jgi:hypothetical protein